MTRCKHREAQTSDAETAKLRGVRAAP